MLIVAGRYRGRPILSPKGDQTRPTSSRTRETVFNICQNYIEGASFLDVFSGSGAMGLEALSRGAQKVVFIDSHPNAIDCLKRNINQLQVQSFSGILKGDVFAMLKILEKEKACFDVVYADPPYSTKIPGTQSNYSTQIIRWMDEHSLIKSGGILFVEESKNEEPFFNDLKTLTLSSRRTLGPSVLQQYQKL